MLFLEHEPAQVLSQERRPLERLLLLSRLPVTSSLILQPFYFMCFIVLLCSGTSSETAAVPGRPEVSMNEHPLVNDTPALSLTCVLQHFPGSPLRRNKLQSPTKLLTKSCIHFAYLTFPASPFCSSQIYNFHPKSLS